MRKRDIFWIGVLLLLGLAYIHFFTNFGSTRTIGITPSLRPPRGRRVGAAVYPVFFSLNGAYRLTSVKVTTTDTNETKPQEHVLWHLVAKEGSEPLNYFLYGQNIQGMTPDLKSASTEPLQTNVIYHLELMAGKVKGVKDFQTRPIPQ